MNSPSRIALLAFALATTSSALTSTDSPAPQRGRSHAMPADTRPVIEIYKSPSCECCKQWVAHMQAAGFDTRVVDLEQDALDRRKAELGVSPRLQSCHTAVAGGYVIEGHVPASDVTRLLGERPAIRGLAVPGMPRGTPGMEMPGGSRDAYEVVAFDRTGTTSVYARH